MDRPLTLGIDTLKGVLRLFKLDFLDGVLVLTGVTGVGARIEKVVGVDARMRLLLRTRLLPVPEMDALGVTD